MLLLCPLSFFFIFSILALMGALTKVGWQRMDVLVAEHGEDDLLHMVCDQVAGGLSLSDLSRIEGVPYTVLWKWLKGKDDRFKAYCLSLEAKADAIAHDTLRDAAEATPEDVQVAKLRIDTKKWAASRWDRDRYGDQSKVAVDVRYQVDLLGALEEAEERRRRLNERVIEGEVI